MIAFYLIGVLLLCGAIVILLGLTPESVTDDLMKFISPKQTLRDKVLIAKGKKKSRKLTVEILHIKEALDATGKGKQFTIACAASILLLIVGCIVAVILDNYFLIPVLAVAFASLPFFYIKTTISAYDRHVKEELETALSIITTSYIRSDDILGAVQENISYLKPPIRGIFQTFVGEAMMISEVKKEYWMMVFLVVGNIPLLYMLNESWFEALMFTTAGKVVLAICGIVIFITALFMMKFTKPIEYRK